MTNYFVLFLAGLWYTLTMTDFVRDLFTIYDSYLFKKSKGFILKIRTAYWNYFGRQLVTEEDIRRYKYGAIQEVDENLISAWKNRKKLQYVLECLGRIELSMARHALQSLKEKISFMGISPEDMHGNLARAEGELHEKESDVIKYEEAFYKRAGESGLL